MLIKDLIAKLEKLYESEKAVLADVGGEPEIVIDVFDDLGNSRYRYGGFITSDIIIERSKDGVYPIISAFADTYSKERQKP
jgi:hypothetical protein